MSEATGESICSVENPDLKCQGDISSLEEVNVKSDFKFSASPSFENM